MIESSQAEPIRDGGRAESDSAVAFPFLTGRHLYSCRGLIKAEEGKRERGIERVWIHRLFPLWVFFPLQTKTFSPAAGTGGFNPPAGICMSFPQVSLSINWFQIEDSEHLKPIKSSGGVKQQRGGCPRRGGAWSVWERS